MRLHGAVVTGLLAIALAVCPSVEPAVARGPADAAKKLLAEGKHGEALQTALTALRTQPDDLDLLEIAARGAAGADRKDDALWLVLEATRIATGRRRDHPKLAALGTLREELDPLPAEQRPDIARHAEQILALGRRSLEKRYFVNAVELLARLEYSHVAVHAESLLERIYADENAVAALLDSSVPLPVTTTFEKRRRKSAREEAKHTDWKKAWKLKSRNYTVLCNAGYELTERASLAMERINGFYRGVFDYKAKKRRSKTKHCQVRIMKSRAEYLANGGLERALAHYSPSEVAVVGYDPRSQGRPLSSLWPMLFHEASHQFTDLIAKAPVPSWLNEGTASYFEGTQLRVDGGIDTNLVPMGRLDDLVTALQTGEPSVKAVVSHDLPGSYPTEYYSVGWGLVYFALNYEDEKGERVYEMPYREFMDTYRQGKTKPKAYERFVEHFVEGPAQEGVTTFDEFAERFTDWIYALNDLHRGPPDRSHDLLLQARVRRERGHLERADASLRHAIRKDPGNVAALLELAELCTARGQKDEALARLRMVVEQAARVGEVALRNEGLDYETVEALLADASARIVALDADFGATLSEVDAGFAVRIEASADAYRDAGYSRTATRVIDDAISILDGHDDLEMERQIIWDQDGLAVLLWREVTVGDDLVGWWSTPEFKAEGGALIGSVPEDELRAALRQGNLPPRYHFEALLTATRRGEYGMFGLVVGVDPDGAWELVGPGGEWVEVSQVFQSLDVLGSPRGLSPEEQKHLRLGVEVIPGRARIYVNGMFCGEQDFERGALRGGIGVFASDADVRVSELRLAY